MPYERASNWFYFLFAETKQPISFLFRSDFKQFSFFISWDVLPMRKFKSAFVYWLLREKLLMARPCSNVRFDRITRISSCYSFGNEKEVLRNEKKHPHFFFFFFSIRNHKSKKLMKHMALRCCTLNRAYVKPTIGIVCIVSATLVSSVQCPDYFWDLTNQI